MTRTDEIADPEKLRESLPLLRQAVEWAEREEDRQIEEGEYSRADEGLTWIQGTWVSPPPGADEGETCGTGCCIAGYIGIQLDKRYISEWHVDGIHVSDFAAISLGLLPVPTREDIENETFDYSDSPWATRLFSGDNDATAVRKTVEVLAREIGEEL